MKISVYSKAGCAPCAMLKQYLTKKGIEFKNIDVVENPEAMAEAYAYSGLSTVPVTVVDKDGDKSVISGFNLQILAPLLA